MNQIILETSKAWSISPNDPASQRIILKIVLSVVIINSSVLSKLQILNGFYFNRRSELQKKARKGGSKTQLSEKNHH